MTKLSTLIKRWEHRAEFFEALLTRLCEQMTKVLRDHTPGKTLPLEWSYDVEITGSRVEARVWNQRLEDDPAFERIMLYLDLGTSDHWVAPVKASALHWIDEKTGEDRFSKGHEVSGIKASDFSVRAEIVLLKFRERIPKLWSAYMSTGRMS